MTKRTKGTEAEVVATIALADKALGLPAEGQEQGKGPHVSSVSQRRSMGMVTVEDLEGVEHTYEAFETLHGVHEPFVTETYDKPRQHPTDKFLYDCAALDPAKAKKLLTQNEQDDLQGKWDASEVADASWEDDQGADEQ